MFESLYIVFKTSRVNNYDEITFLREEGKDSLFVEKPSDATLYTWFGAARKVFVLSLFEKDSNVEYHIIKEYDLNDADNLIEWLKLFAK